MSIMTQENPVDEDQPILVVDFPDIQTDKNWKDVIGRPEVYMTTNLKKKRVEINERRATSVERELIQKGKCIEIQEFLQEKVVKAATEQEMKTLKPEDVMKMRFVLTWKVDPASPTGKKAKARLVVLGFQDPFLGKEDTLAPTMQKRTRSLLLSKAVQERWRIFKADVKAAFLQGNKFKDEEKRYALPPPELAKALGMDPKDKRPVRLEKSVYGLTRAPLDWYKRVGELLVNLGGIQMKSDPCVWIFHERDETGNVVVENGKARVIGMIGAYVDDFLIAGETGNPQWEKPISTLEKSFRWTPWESWHFKQTGLTIQQNPETFEIELSQQEYLDTITEIEIPPARKNNPKDAATDSEKTNLRGLLGALQWLHTQSRMDIAAEVGLLQSSSKNATVASLLEANRILRKARKNAENTAIKIRKIPDEVIVTGWSDASLKNRVDDASTGGYIIGLSSTKILEGEREQITPISWRSYKLRRVAVSSLSAETQALRGMEDEMHMVRLAWAEMTGILVDLSECQ